jgi:two-component system sensor histidine kinase DesK
VSASDQQGDPALRVAWAFAAAFLGLVLPVRLSNAAYWTGPAGVAVTMALFVLPLLFTVPRGRVVWVRHRDWLLAAQAVLTYLPFVIFGQEWIVGLSGLLAGLLLLTLGAPASWILFGAVLAVEGVLRIAVLPLPGASLSYTVSAFTTPVNIALTLFGLVRLADLVTDLHATRMELASLAVARQRLRSASRLREAIGVRIETIAARARAALPVLAHNPDQARGQITEAAGEARQALDQVRAVVAGDDHDHNAPDAGEAGDAVAPRLARLVLVLVLCAISAQVLANVRGSDTAATDMAGTTAVIITIVAMQLYHTLARREGTRPRGWAWTLAAQTLSIAFVGVSDELSLLGMAGFPAGSALLLLPGRWRWAAFVAIPASVGALMAAYSAYGMYDAVNLAAATATTGLVVYGLSRLTDLAHRVASARRELARMAAVQEQLRVARDTHDLLGLGLSAVALKCDLIVRLIGRDDTKARSELEQLLKIAARAHDDALSVTSEAHHRLSLRTELDAARDTLASAGVGIRIDVTAVPLPPAVDAVLATVLREAITNILRHATVEQCAIQLSMTDEVIRLRITNDGAATPAATRTGGAGLPNLRARVRALDGHLTAGSDGEGRFKLAVEIPVT